MPSCKRKKFVNRTWRDVTNLTQAERIIKKFGGVRRLAALYTAVNDHKLHTASAYRWQYPVAKRGTGGLIPHRYIPGILRAAAADGIILTPADLTPEEYGCEADYEQNNYLASKTLNRTEAEEQDMRLKIPAQMQVDKSVLEIKAPIPPDANGEVGEGSND